MGTWHLSRPLNETSEQALQQPGGKGSQQKEQVVKHLRLSCVGGTEGRPELLVLGEQVSVTWVGAGGRARS